jgi:radical SAM/Cys-rich protein
MATKSLKARGNNLVLPVNQVAFLSKTDHIPSFGSKLKETNLLPLRPTSLEVMQINVGYMCNQVCEHCHVDAGPDRKEIMLKETMEYCLKAIDNSKVNTVDLTGGAPEMNPNFLWFVEELSKRDVKVIVRSNLTILEANKNYKTYPEFFKKHGIVVIASLPCYTAENVDKQRGDGVFNDSINALIALNAIGYGKDGSGLELNLVFNPIGPSLPPSQDELQADYKRELMEHFGIVFNNLYTITNLPISRYLEYLTALGKYESYMEILANAYNPAAAENVMCRNTISVSWDGNLYDCDFNQMLDLKVESKAPQHIKDFALAPLENRNIIINQHCYGCTAGAGSSCQGAVI